MEGHGGRVAFTDVERRRWQDPEAVLKRAGLKRGMTFVDVGSGHGFFSIPAARISGPSGKVISVDADPASLAILRDSAEKEGLRNVETILGMAEETIPCIGCADVVFFGMALHDFQDPNHVLLNARRMLKENGVLVDLDWKKEEMGIGPPVSIRFDEAFAAQMISEKGFRVISSFGSGPYHYVITARLDEEVRA